MEKQKKLKITVKKTEKIKVSYRPSRIKQSTAQSNSSQASNDAYEYQEPDSYEFDIAKQLEKRRNESVQVRQEDKASRSDTFNRLTTSKRLREDDVQLIDIKSDEQ